VRENYLQEQQKQAQALLLEEQIHLLARQEQLQEFEQSLLLEPQMQAQIADLNLPQDDKQNELSYPQVLMCQVPTLEPMQPVEFKEPQVLPKTFHGLNVSKFFQPFYEHKKLNSEINSSQKKLSKAFITQIEKASQTSGSIPQNYNSSMLFKPPTPESVNLLNKDILDGWNFSCLDNLDNLNNLDLEDIGFYDRLSYK